MTRFLKETVLPRFAALVIRLLVATLRIEVVDPEGVAENPPPGPLLFPFWHNRLLIMSCLYRRYFPARPGVAMASRSRDGAIVAGINREFRVLSVRGSTSRGNLAAREVIRHVNEGCDLAITPDGPRGPRCVVQPGVVQIAQITGRPIVPVTYHLERRWTLRSWDRFQIPVPFTRCRVVFSPRIEIPRELAEGEIGDYCLRIKAALGE